ncbi:uncharacterized protein ACN2A1_011167 isoform 1-T1 [Glossina fuscipes fuscipes]
MTSITTETVKSFCRACLKELPPRQRYTIYCLDYRVRYWLQDATLKNALATDIYSHFICRDCREKVEDFLEFREMCARSRKRVKDLAEKEAQKALKTLRSEYHVSDPALQTKILDEIYGSVSWTDMSEDDFNNNETVDSEDLKDCEKKSWLPPSQISSPYKLRDSFGYFPDIENQSDHDHNETEISQKNVSNILYRKPTSMCSVSICSDDSKRNNEKPRLLTKVDTITANTMQTEITNKKFQYHRRCDQCERHLNEETLQQHIRAHQAVMSHCPNCERNFDYPNCYRPHVEEVYCDNKLNIVGEDSQFCPISISSPKLKKNGVSQQASYRSLHFCGECGKVCESRPQLKDRISSHKPKNLYPFQCKECNSCFKTQRSLRGHEQRHASNKIFECPHCGMRKNTYHELKAHINHHTTAKQQPCPKCNMVFNSAGGLTMHDRIAHFGLRRLNSPKTKDCTVIKQAPSGRQTERPFNCQQCGKRFIHATALKAHMRTHINCSLQPHRSVPNLTEVSDDSV